MSTSSALTHAPERLYRIGLWIKGLNGVLELLGGAAMLFVPARVFDHIVSVLSRHHLGHDTRDRFFALLGRGIQHLGGDDRTFVVFYLLSHGVVKVVIATLLLRDVRSAYPYGIALYGLLIVYEIYRFLMRPGVLISGVVVLDLAILTLILIQRKAG